MQQAAERDSWVERVLGIDLRVFGQQLDTQDDALSGHSRAGNGLDASDETVEDTGFRDKIKDKLLDLRGKTPADDVRKSDKVNISARLAGLADPASATDDEKAAFKKLREAVAKAITPDAPPPSALESAEKAVAKLSDLIDKAQRRVALSALETKNPNAAEKAREAFAQFDKVLGGVEVTPEAQRESRSERERLEKELLDATAKLNAAARLEDGPDKSKQLAAAKSVLKSATSALKKATEFDNAMTGRSGLLTAISHGPLSPETANPFKSEVAEKLIAAYSKDALIANAAVKTASTAEFPGAIAAGLNTVIDLAQSRFESKEGRTFTDAGYARTYAQRLLKSGGSTGPDFFSGLSDYIEAGNQFKADPLGAKDATTFSQIAQKRSVAVARALLTPNGGIDVKSDAAHDVIDHLLYHPSSVGNGTPALNAHVVKMVGVLGNPATGPQASNVLTGMGAPANSGARSLVRGSLGKGTSDTVDAGDARTAALAAMLKPIRQGAVGSCFATAPARRMCETQPLDALKAYASLASRGKYKPPFGAEVPAITKLPADDDPLIRSFEYSTATAVARKSNSVQRTRLASSCAGGAELLKDVATTGDKTKRKSKSWQNKKAKLVQDIAAAFTFTYDPTSTVTDANDGKSSTGRYIVQKIGGGEIRTKQDFEGAMIEIALASLGIDPASPEAAEVERVVRSPEFETKVCPADYKPWELASGGATDGATKILFGDSLQQKSFTPEAGKPPPPEGERTKEVLTGFLKSFQSGSPDMVTIRTVGKHGFNALPNNPSLAKLKGSNDTETAQKVQTELVDKGQQIKDTELSPERAAWLFDEAINRERDAETDKDQRDLLDAEAKARRPKVKIKPAALTALIGQALDAYHDKLAENLATKWKSGEETNGKVIDIAALATKRSDLKKALDDSATNGAKTALMRDLGVPQFVLADSNWGDSRSLTLFVIAPDPATGEPLLWERTEPGGAMSPAGRDWVDSEWASIA